MTSPENALVTATEADFGARVRDARKGKKWSQRELGERLGLDASAVSRLEAGVRMVRLGEAAQIADALDVPLASLVVPTVPTARMTAALADVDEAVGEARSAIHRAIHAVLAAERVAANPDTPADVVEAHLGAGPDRAREALTARVERVVGKHGRAVVPPDAAPWAQEIADLLVRQITHVQEKR